ncbi:MAG TPA: protease HtpX [Myxococcota bacterium]|nr:protease HtpX [Myxococcota bacterium]
MKRVFLFLVTNIAVLFVLSIVARVAGVSDPSQLGGLLVMAAIFGMGGATISLFLSKWMAKMSTGARVISEPRSDAEHWLVNTVQNLAHAAGIGMPEVAIFDSPQPNAFATGARRDAALVAVSSGLLQTMKPDEIEGVLGHEITHVSNGDMVTLTLVQGVVNTFVIFLSRVVGSIVDRAVFQNDRDGGRRGGGPGYFVTVMVLQLVFGIAASLIVYAFSRAREYRADAGGARLAGRQNMIAALQRLLAAHPEPLPEQMKAFGIAGDAARSFGRLFMTHPPLQERIARLQAMTDVG